MKICKIDGCGNKHKARGWCKKHYTRWCRHGDPNIVLREMHGYSRHHLYGVWRNMKRRCYEENNKRYKDYGGKGITVCNEWKNSSKAFIDWALPLWKEGLEIDRKKNNGNYESSNCHFVTHEENQQNRELLQSNNASGYRGVSWKDKKWRAQITINNKLKHLGYFVSAKEAALTYDNAIIDNRPRNFITKGDL